MSLLQTAADALTPPTYGEHNDPANPPRERPPAKAQHAAPGGLETASSGELAVLGELEASRALLAQAVDLLERLTPPQHRWAPPLLEPVAASSSPVTQLLEANVFRAGATIYNDGTTPLYVAFGFDATATRFTVKLNPGDYFELPGPRVWTGRVSGVWAGSPTGNAYVTEWAG